jgi:hypothetical protein
MPNGGTTALVQINTTTVIIQGQFAKTDVPILVSSLVPR